MDLNITISKFHNASAWQTKLRVYSTKYNGLYLADDYNQIELNQKKWITGILVLALRLPLFMERVKKKPGWKSVVLKHSVKPCLGSNPGRKNLV